MSPTAPDVPDPRRWWTLVVLCFSLLVIGLDNTILNVALPTLQEDLDASASQLQWIVDSYMLVFAAALLTAGALGDRFGRKKALTFGLVVFGLGSGLSALAGSSDMLIAHPRADGHRRRVHHAVDALDPHRRRSPRTSAARRSGSGPPSAASASSSAP